ncbi:hypothetical protein CRU96_09600 [Malaciobacter halophilus]|nr:hypothetical protein [Malaciobacter halophilus]RYA23120.1 hypothetical protein CRU96_09600 [Malaciobacter halophilus]
MEKKRSVWWKIYFYIFSGLILLYMYILLFESNEIFNGLYKSEVFYLIFEFVLFLFSFIGLFGYVYQKKIFYKDFWIFIFVLLLVDNIGSLLLESQIKEYIWFYIIFIPLYIALYKYSFKMNELWSENGK